MLPQTIVRESWESVAKRYVTNVSNSYQATWGANGVYQLKTLGSGTTVSQCGTSPTSCTVMRTQGDSYVTDAYGNVTEHSAAYGTFSDSARRTEVERHYFLPAEGNWLIGLPDPARPSTYQSTAPAAPSIGGTETVTRTIKLTPDTVHGGISSVHIEPTGHPDDNLLRTFGRDGLGRLASITEREFGDDEERATTLEYLDEDGAHVSRITNSLGHVTRLWRHPGLRLLGRGRQSEQPRGDVDVRHVRAPAR